MPARCSKTRTSQPQPRTLESLPDQQLLEIAQCGDERAFTLLCARYRYPLFVYCRRRVSDRGIAEDIVQDTLLAAWEHLNACETWRGWIYRIAGNRCASTLRAGPQRSATTSPVPLETIDHAAPPAAEPAALHEQREVVAQLFAAAGALPPRQQQVIRRRLIGTSFRDIAGQLGITEKAARQAACDARRHLRRNLD
jgi:RNA polymerase sigma factor (sigma-70 family)